MIQKHFYKPKPSPPTFQIIMSSSSINNAPEILSLSTNPLVIPQLKNLLKHQHTYSFFNPSFHQDEAREEILISWLFRYASEFRFQEITVSLSIGIFDSLVSLVELSFPEMVLVGITSLFLACKMHESQAQTTRFAVGFPSFNLLRSELEILNLLNFRLPVVTPLDVAYALLEHEPLKREIIFQNLSDKNSLKKFRRKVEEVDKVLCLDYTINSFVPGAVACAVVMIAKHELSFERPYGANLQGILKFKEEEVDSCFDKLLKVFCSNVKKFSGESGKHPGEIWAECESEEAADGFSFLSFDSKKKKKFFL